MKHLIPRILIATATALLGASCVSNVESRIERYPDKYARLSDSHKAMIREGRIKEGMNKDAVYLAWGTPGSVRQGSSGGKEVETWTYIGHYPVWTDSITFGYARYGRDCGRYFDYGPTVQYVPYNAAQVRFANDRVSGWDRQR